MGLPWESVMPRIVVPGRIRLALAPFTVIPTSKGIAGADERMIAFCGIAVFARWLVSGRCRSTWLDSS